MALGSSPSTHRKRSEAYTESTEHSLKSFHSAIAQGSCFIARNALIAAAETAGAAAANDREVRRRKKRAFTKHPAIRMVAAAKKVMQEKCPMNFKGKKAKKK